MRFVYGKKNIPCSQSIRNIFLISIVYIIYMSIHNSCCFEICAIFNHVVFFWGGETISILVWSCFPGACVSLGRRSIKSCRNPSVLWTAVGSALRRTHWIQNGEFHLTNMETEASTTRISTKEFHGHSSGERMMNNGRILGYPMFNQPLYQA